MFKRIYFDNKSKHIHLWETYNGKDVKSNEPFEYKYYVQNNKSTSDIKDIDNNPVLQLKTRNKDKMDSLKNNGLKLYETDIPEEVQYLQYRYQDVDLKPDINDFKIAYLDIEVESEFEFPKPEEAKFPINLITVYHSTKKTYCTWGIREYTGDSPLVGEYRYFADERRMLADFIKWFRLQNFDILTGWYVKDFDVHYILKRKENLEIGEELTSLKKYYHTLKTMISTDPKSGVTMKRKVYYCNIAGLNILDSLELYKKFTFDTLESYQLNFVAHHLGLEGKLELEGQVNNEWKNNWNRFVEYNIQDVILVKQIEEKKKHIQLAIQFASEALIPIDRVFSSIATVEGYILRNLHKQNMVMPDKKHGAIDEWHKQKLYIEENGHKQNVKDGEDDFDPFFVKGAYVEATNGLFKNLMAYDLTSLYPWNIIQFNISPEVKIFNPTAQRIAKGDLISTPINGVYYLKNKTGIIPQVVEKIFNERKAFKDLSMKYENEGNKDLAKYYDSQQHIRKILINSFYGCLANKHSHFYDVDNARVITRAGRTLIKYLSNTTNNYFKQCWPEIAKEHFPNLKEYPKIEKDLVAVIDTDSCYLCLDEVKEKYAPDMPLIDFCHKVDEDILEPFYDKILEIFANKHNAKHVQNFKREDIITKQLVLAKKKYIKIVLQHEKVIYDEPKFKATGGEIVKSDVPKLCRRMIKETVNILFTGDVPNKEDVLKHIKKVKKEYKEQKKEEISSNKSVNEYTKYAEPTDYYIKKKGLIIKKSTPIHVRASMNYNYMIAKYNLPYTPVNNGTKIKYVYLNPKNILGTDVIAFIGNWPKEFDKYFVIDYRLQFHKSFLKAIQGIFDVMNWGEINLRAGGLSKFMKKR